MKHIKVMQIPGKSVTVEVADGATEAECVAAAGFDTSGYQVSSSGDANNVPNGGTVVLSRKVKGA